MPFHKCEPSDHRKEKKNKHGQETTVAYSWLNLNHITQRPDAIRATLGVDVCWLHLQM